MTTNFLSKGTELIHAAVSADNSEDYESAIRLYSQGIEYLLTALKYEKNQKIIEAIQSKAIKYLKRAEDIKDALKSKSNQQNNPQNQNISNNNNNNDFKSNGDDDDAQKLKNSLCSAIVIEKPDVQWSDVAGLEVAKSLLKEAVILPTRFPQLFTGARKPFEGILLYGPPGTGKSYLAKAVANEADQSTFISVSSSDLISKFVGESAKLIRYLYTLAKNSKPSIIFIDEIDSLATARNDNDTSSSRSVKTELLVQMQGVGNNCRGVLTLGATNCPWDLDPAVRRRFAKRVYIPLPDIIGRTQMFRLHVGNDNILLNDNDYRILASKTDGYSGSDIYNICQDALMEPIRTLQTATHFKKIFNKNKNNNDYCYIPCSSGDLNGIKMNLMDFNNNEQDKIKCESLKLSHFLRVLQNATKSVSQNDLNRYVKWTQDFGQQG